MEQRKSTVKARLHQLESAVASADHQSSHPEVFRSHRNVGHSSTSTNESDEEDGTFAFRDLVRALTSENASGSGSEQEALRMTFEMLDCDEDGFITLNDLREAMSGFEEDEDEEEAKMSEEDLVEMIAAADKKGDGRISFESFVAMLEPSGGKEKKKRSREKKSAPTPP